LTKRRIVIIGGGIAGLTAAFELTRTPELQARYDVTVYQMGWRPGGKITSGRDEDGRNIEHGLHIWFGFYENAFRLMLDVYREWRPPSGQKITQWADAISAQTFTPIGNGHKTQPPWFDVTLWPNAGEPGRGDVDLSLRSCVGNLFDLLLRFYEGTLRANAELRHLEPRIPISSDHPVSTQVSAQFSQRNVPVTEYLHQAARRISRIDENAPWACSDDIEFARTALATISSAVNLAGFSIVSDGDILAQALELAAAFIAGLLTDILLEQRTIQQIDGEDFRHWLVRHGAKPSVASGSPLVKALYDTMFQYPGGKIASASYGAGTAAQVLLRMLATSRGSVAWELQAGSGEVVIAPLFEVLIQRGVQFQFFHKLTAIQLSLDGSSVSSLQFDRQINLKVSDAAYDPVQMHDGLRGFGCTPDWNLIENGEALKQSNVDLESYWCNQMVGTVPVVHGCDFDDAILAIPVGAFKDLGSGGGPCSELIGASQQFKAMTEKLELVPSMAVQFWSTLDLAGLGWGRPKPALVSGPEPLAIWADMSQLLAYEPQGPKSLHYLCDVFPTELYRRPSDQAGVQQEAQRDACCLTRRWLEDRAYVFWPNVAGPGWFDWQALFVSKNSIGSSRLCDQYIHANINPSDCCVATAAGTSAWRLKTDASGFDHLYLAGSWIDTGFNTECLEAAVMSGMQAVRAITGEEMSIPGETFLHATLEYLVPCDLLRRYALVSLCDD
jgi:uncharacterized protein with NAD-binding domain and iron-sulfur cluster